MAASVDFTTTPHSGTSAQFEEEHDATQVEFINILDWQMWTLGPQFFLMLLGFVFNTITIIAYLKSPLLRTGKPAHQLIFNVTVTDLASCISCQPFYVFQYTQIGTKYIRSRKISCLFTFIIVAISFEATTVALLLFSVERLFAITSPLQHMHKVTRKTCKIAIIISWLLIFLKNAPMFFWNDWEMGDLCIGVEIMTSVYGYSIYLSGLYGEMGAVGLLNLMLGLRVIASKRQAAKMKADKQDVKARSEMKIVKILMLAVGILFATWVPNNTMTNIMFGAVRNGRLPSKFVYLGYHLTRCANLLGAVADPVLYFWHNHQCRKAVLDLFGWSKNEKKTNRKSVYTVETNLEAVESTSAAK